MPSKPLHELYLAARLGKPGALNELLSELRPRLHAVGTHLVPPELQAKIDASDIVQNTLKDAFEGFDTFRGATVHEFWSWICTIHCNNAMSMVSHFSTQCRDFKVEISIQECPSVQIETRSLQEVTLAEQRELLRKAFQRLPPDYQAILDLKTAKGMDYRQISEILGENEATLRKRYSRAMKRWTEKLQDLRQNGDV